MNSVYKRKADRLLHLAVRQPVRKIGTLKPRMSRQEMLKKMRQDLERGYTI